MSPAQLLENFLQLLTAGILTGILYGLMCVGLSIIFGVMRIINFAQGEFMMLGMYIACYGFGLLGIQVVFGDIAGPYIAALAAGPIVFLIGAGLHKLLISQVTGASTTTPESERYDSQLILTLGISLILSNGGLVLFGSAPVSISAPLSSTPWVVGPLIGDAVTIVVNPGQTVAAIVAVIVVGVVTLLMTRTRLGLSLRATTDNPQAATFMGIDVDRVYRNAFAFGVAITAIGGALFVSSTPARPDIGMQFVVVMYAGVVLGGLGSIGGAFMGGLLVGLFQQLSTLVLPMQLQNTSIFVCFLLIVLLKPNGIFGRAGSRA